MRKSTCVNKEGATCQVLPNYITKSQCTSHASHIRWAEAHIKPPPVLYFPKLGTARKLSLTMQPDDYIEVEVGGQTAKRNWRFYGTFGTLALLNLICAIDATILSVALPVREHLKIPSPILTTRQDDSYRSKRYHCNPSFLGWDFFPLVSSRRPSPISVSTNMTPDARQSFNLHGHHSHTSSTENRSFWQL